MSPKGLCVLLFRYYINNQGEKRSTIIGTFKIRCKGTKYFSYMQTFLQKNFKKNQKRKLCSFIKNVFLLIFNGLQICFGKLAIKKGDFFLNQTVHHS